MVKLKKNKLKAGDEENWRQKLQNVFGEDPVIHNWLVSEIEKLILSTEEEIFSGRNIRWSEWGNLELDGIYDSIRNQTSRNDGCIDKFIMHEPTKRVFRLGFTY